MDQDEILKKLILHGIAKLDLDQAVERPFSIREEKEILDRFSDVDCNDTIHLSIYKERKESDRLFSKGAFNRFLHTVRLFIGGRILGYFRKYNDCPQVAVVTITVEYMTKEEFDKHTWSRTL